MRNDEATTYWREKNHHYVYPVTEKGKRINLKPGSETHGKILNAIRDQAEEMWTFAAPVRKKCREITNDMDCVVPKRTAEQSVAKLRVPNKPMNVMIPLTRACREYWTAFAMQEFTSPYGNYMLDGEGPDGMFEAAIMEIVLNAQAVWFGHNQSLMTFFRDSATFPVAAMTPVWSKHRVKNTVNAQIGQTVAKMIHDLLPDAQAGEFLNLLEEQTLHEGNRLQNIDPNKLLIHPKSITSDFESQRRAYCKGYLFSGNAYDVAAREKDPEEKLFNGRYLMDLCEGKNGNIEWLNGTLFTDESGRSDNYGLAEPEPTTSKINDDYFEGVRVFWWLRPKKWGLGESDDPQEWVFTVAGDEVIIEAHPVDSYSGYDGMFIGSPANDGYHAYPTSMLTQIQGINEFLNWKVRSVISADTKSLNGILIARHNALLNNQDLLNRDEQGGVIWAAPEAEWGVNSLDLRSSFHQLTTTPPDPNWPSSLSVFLGLGNQIFGTPSVVRGEMAEMPDRPTAFGINTANDNASERMALYAESLRWQWYNPMVFHMGMNTIQYLDQKSHYNIVGSWREQELREAFGAGPVSLPISPADLSNKFRVSVQSHRQRARQLQAMQMLVDRMLSNPEIAQQEASIYGHQILRSYMRMTGLPNMTAFAQQNQDGLNTQVMPDDQIRSMRDSGQAVSMNEVAGRNAG